jgi:hypothetical protein
MRVQGRDEIHVRNNGPVPLTIDFLWNEELRQILFAVDIKTIVGWLTNTDPLRGAIAHPIDERACTALFEGLRPAATDNDRFECARQHARTRIRRLAPNAEVIVRAPVPRERSAALPRR